MGRTPNKGMVFNGATMELCITAPKVKPSQFSSARLHIQMGDDFIQMGITVSYLLFHYIVRTLQAPVTTLFVFCTLINNFKTHYICIMYSGKSITVQG